MVADQALSALLLFHGLAMNGGVLHASESLTPEELEAAILGYHFYGFDDVVNLVIESRSAVERNDQEELEILEIKLDKRYSDFIDGDSKLVEHFKIYFQNNPAHFAPLEREAFLTDVTPPRDAI
jgi:hypothetical protein